MRNTLKIVSSSRQRSAGALPLCTERTLFRTLFTSPLSTTNTLCSLYCPWRKLDYDSSVHLCTQIRKWNLYSFTNKCLITWTFSDLISVSLPRLRVDRGVVHVLFSASNCNP